MKTYLPKETLDKKLCLDCKYFLNALNGLYKCLLYTNKVDGDAAYYCHEIREDESKCGGNKWVCRKELYQADSQEEADKLNYEENVNSYKERAKIIVDNKFTDYISNGYLDEAIRRLKK